MSTERTKIKPKATVKRLVDGHPGLLKDNRLYYEVQKWRAYRKIEVRPELTDRQDMLQGLQKDGIVVVSNYVPSEQATAMLAASEDTLEKAKNRELRDSASSPYPKIVVRIASADHLIPALRPFFADPVIRSVMNAYMSPNVSSYRHELEYRYGLAHEEVRQTDLYHFDNWRPICKAFLYLTDVTEDNAPFVYLKGTHELAGWRRRHDVTYDVHGETGPFGHFFPQEIRELRRRFGWDELVCIGPAGTLIIADFRGLHRGTPMRSGRRVLLNNTFDLMNPELELD